MTNAAGEPLHRVRVALNAPAPNPPSSVTDTRGEFEITGVPSGSYYLTATRAGYLTIQYGQRRPREAGRTTQVKPGEIVEGINFALPRGAVLAGTITDDVGEPYQGVRVEAVELRYVRGRRVPVQAASATTNDLGQYRLSALQPGTYLLRASSTDTWQDDEGANSYVYAHTFFPGVTGSDQAQPTNLGVGQEVGNLNFGMRSGRPATITGIIQNPEGQPMPGQVIGIDRATRGIGGALVSLGGGGPDDARSDKTGAFEFKNVPPGEYVVYSGAGADRIAESVVVADGDTKSVVLDMRKASTLSGTIITDDRSPLPFPASQLRVVPISADPDTLFDSFTGIRETTVARDATFRFNDIRGQYLFRLTGMPDEWTLSGVVLGDRNYIDTALEFERDGNETKGLQLVISKTAGKVSGDVLTRDGKPAPDSTVVIFPPEPGRWTIASRFIKAVRPDNAGRFTIAGLPAGNYRIAAREFVPEGQWEDPEFLTALLATATRIELTEGASETVTLRVEPQP